MTNPTKKPVALVTGSGRGIGAAIALAVAREGYSVVVNSRTADPARREHGAYAVLAEIEAAGGSGIVVKGDISSPADREALLGETLEAHGRIDLLVNNAGIAPSVRTDILEADEASFDHIMGVNLKGPYFLTQIVANKMIELKNQGVIKAPRIAFVTSISAFATSTNRGEYCVSKAALSMTSALFADRLGGEDIPVVEIRPGVIATDMTSGVREKYDTLIDQGIFPQRRWGQPDDIARLVCALARGAFDYSTGAVIDVSGGFNLKRL